MGLAAAPLGAFRAVMAVLTRLLTDRRGSVPANVAYVGCGVAIACSVMRMIGFAAHSATDTQVAMTVQAAGMGAAPGAGETNQRNEEGGR